MVQFSLLNPKMMPEYLGLIPSFLTDWDARPAKEQINDNYQHGGGWRPIDKFKLVKPVTDLERHISPYRVARTLILEYPGDPPLKPLAVAQIRDETIVFYDGAFLAIFQPDYSFEVARID